MTANMSVDEIKTLIFGLPPGEFLTLVDAIEERAETVAMMRLAETGFGEWNDAEEDIYDAEAQARRSLARFLFLTSLPQNPGPPWSWQFMGKIF